jgi:hypothetical protein
MEIGDAIPITTGNVPQLVSGITNCANTPPSTGVLVSPQSPAGTSVTSTGRTIEATASYMTHSLNAQNVGTTPPPTGSLPTFKG